jgi:16S rRNA (cytidine1402-2'-O)-methyltransferase
LSGKLSIVATPIGNLEDITLRAIRTLRECDGILAEDTRRTKILCAHHGITTRLRSFHAHTSEERADTFVHEMLAGSHLALVTDAGTPIVSDPGMELVRAASIAGVRIEPIPGPSAALAALSASGLRASAFRFVGFLPRAGGARREAIDAIKQSADTTILFESPNRLPATLRDLSVIDRPAIVARELTKLHEEIARGTPADLAARFAEPPRGEITIVIEGGDGAPEPVEIDPEALARALLDEGLRTKDAARALADRTGMSVRDAYTIVLAVAGA